MYIGTAAMIAVNCEQYRLCHTGRCPTGTTTQNPVLEAQLDVETGINRLSNFIRVSTDEMAEFARIAGKGDLHALDANDLVSLDEGLARIAGCSWIGDTGSKE